MRGVTETVTAADPLPPAPGSAQHVALAFANTLLALPAGPVDLLDSPDAAVHWLRAHDLATDDAVLYEYCAGRLRELRSQLRALLSACVEGTPAPPAALQAVNTALTTAPSAALLRWDETRGLHRAPAHPADRAAEHAMAAVAADAAELLTGPDAELMVRCAATPCTRYLLRTHAARHWCSTRCGDRVRAARAYARRTQARDAAKQVD
ncbi:CGNR zinc finger domain-containing protein [Kitasatospora viridis]|uniref:Putative RNA-binding Zn ribbon-like protein n=1 Tax=Kitasatospora viridis TaxID=281105 RepID=A0A561TTP0_9ACTN|nr:ABATE domain-containing protein [Kitasatospora viridis]TWF90463.1 putative RNA-binding Zn ribbon-like protein [Kitasatospora viridis]